MSLDLQAPKRRSGEMRAFLQCPQSWVYQGLAGGAEIQLRSWATDPLISMQEQRDPHGTREGPGIMRTVDKRDATEEDLNCILIESHTFSFTQIPSLKSKRQWCLYWGTFCAHDWSARSPLCMVYENICIS